MEMGEVAEGIALEVQRQNAMVEDVHEAIEGAHDHVESVNDKMKKTLKAVGRPADKLCMDIICLCILLGLAGVIYNLAN